MILLFIFNLFLFGFFEVNNSFLINKIINKFQNKINFDKNKQNKHNKFLILNKKNLIYSSSNITQFLDSNFNKNESIMSISPGGVKGFYLMGTCSYIKQNFNLKNHIFTGASAGSWNSLLMSYNGDFKKLINLIHKIDYDNLKSLYELEINLKNIILNNFNRNEFDLTKIFIGVTIFENFKFKTIIFSDFINLEDAIDCCIASSHIPFITGKFIHKYKNKICFDGGFSNNPYFDYLKKSIHITPTIWNKIYYDDDDDVFTLNKVKLIKLYYDGLNDAEKNKDILKELI